MSPRAVNARPEVVGYYFLPNTRHDPSIAIISIVAQTSSGGMKGGV
jgi:hypothetical protein